MLSRQLLSWVLRYGKSRGRKEGKQVNYARKLGQSVSRDIIGISFLFSDSMFKL